MRQLGQNTKQQNNGLGPVSPQIIMGETLKSFQGESGPGDKEEIMRDRTKQRENRKLKRQMIAMRNACGVVDPTPYYAVKHMLEEQSRKAKSCNKKGVA